MNKIFYIVPYAEKDAYFAELYERRRTDFVKRVYDRLLPSGQAAEIRPSKIKFVYRIVWRKIFRRESSAIHQHWFEARDERQVVRLIFEMMLLQLYVWFGGTVVWTIHNKYAHNRRFMKLNLLAGRFMAKNASVLHIHCPGVIEELTELFHVADPSKFVVYEHPMFESRILDKEAALRNLSEEIRAFIREGIVFVSLGRVDHYKGVDFLVDVFKTLPGYCRLLIVGDFKKDSRFDIDLASLTANIKLCNYFVAEHELTNYYAVADYSIFGFRDILTSGSVHRALSFNNKVILPAIGCLRDLKSNPNVILYEREDKEDLKKKILDLRSLHAAGR